MKVAIDEQLCRCGHPRRLHWLFSEDIETGKTRESSPILETVPWRGECITVITDCDCQTYRKAGPLDQTA